MYYQWIHLAARRLLAAAALLPVVAIAADPATVYNSPACSISSAWCVGNAPIPPVRNYKNNELLLLYDSKTSDQAAEDLLMRYRLQQKRSDNLVSIDTKMITASTNGQDPKQLVDTINQKEKEVDANLSNIFRTASVSTPPVNRYPLELTGIAAAHQRTIRCWCKNLHGRYTH